MAFPKLHLRAFFPVYRKNTYMFAWLPYNYIYRYEVKSWSLEHPPRWEMDWIVRFLSDPGVKSMEDPTNAEDANATDNAGAESGRRGSSEGSS